MFLTKKILLLPFCIGLILIIYSWYFSYPIAVDSVNDSIFNHISFFYWIGLPLLLSSIYLIAITSKSTLLKWVLTVGCLIALYSLAFFYYSISSSDAMYFRGLELNFINTKNLDISLDMYYQWPGFFILSYITTSITGLSVVSYEFVLFLLIGLIFGTALFVYASKIDGKIGFLSVLIYFIVMFYFLNYQAVPFSLAFGLLLILFMLESEGKNRFAVPTLFIFICISLTHSFVPLFFILYTLIRMVLTKSDYYLKFFFLTLSIYLLLQILTGQFSFAANIITAMNLPSEYASQVSSTIAIASNTLDITAQMFSRAVTIGAGLLSFLGFLIIIVKKDACALNRISISILLTGIIYTVIGLLLYTLGSRAVAIAFIPIALGVIYVYRIKKVRIIFHCFVISMLVLAVFIPVHTTFNDSVLNYQTKEQTLTAEFAIHKVIWDSNELAIADFGAKWYISSQIGGYNHIDTAYAGTYPLSNITSYHCIIYSIGLERTIQTSGIPLNKTLDSIGSEYNIPYNSGVSFIALKSQS
jgi:hypothetical protein